MTIDSHQHFWQYNPIRDSWITDEMLVIQRDFMPGDLSPVLKSHGIDGCVAVQADQSERETDFLLELSDQYDFIKGVVGWVNLCENDLNERLEYYSHFNRLKGFRHVLQGEPDGYMTHSSFVQGVRKLLPYNLSYDILTYHHQLPEVCELLALLPEMPLVIDHISKPNINEGLYADWAKNMKAISEYPHVHVKLSGMVTEADWKSWEKDDFHRYMDLCLESFGTKRLMYGSDWPVCLVAGSYDQVIDLVQSYIARLSNSEQADIMGLTATRFYKLQSN